MAYTGIFATGCGICTYQAQVYANQMSRSRHIAREAVTSVKAAFPNWVVNWSIGSFTETAPPGTTTIGANLEYNGVSYPLLWSGASTVSVSGVNTTALSDALSVSIPAGAEFFIRTYFANSSSYVLVNSGSGVGAAVSGCDTANGEGWGVLIGDQRSGTGVLTGSLGGLIYRPCLLVATITNESWFLFGDSRQYGLSDNFSGTSGDRGQLARSIGQLKGYVNVGVPGDSVSLFNSSHAKRLALAAYCSHALCEYGINDLVVGSAATVAANLVTAKGYFSIPVYQSTITPKTTSSDSWATTANQTLDGRNSERVALNALIRAGLSGFAGYFEVADLVESGRDSGKWKVTGAANYATADGVHESTAANLLIMAGSLPTAPTIGTASLTGTTASIPFTAGSGGFVATTSFTVTATPGGATASGASSPLSIAGLTVGTAYTFKVKANTLIGASPESAASNSLTAPASISSPTGTATGATTGTGTVSTDVGSGTLYYYASTNATETAATIKAQGSQAVSASGSQSVSFTGLSGSTTYYAHYVQVAGAVDSNVVNSTSFTTSAASTPVGFSGTVPAQTGTVSSAYILALSGYFAGTLTPFTYSVLSGSLPAGVTLNTSTGTLSGTPTTAGSYSAVVRTTDTGSNTADTGTIAFTISAAAPAPSPPPVTTSTSRRLMVRELMRGVS